MTSYIAHTTVDCANAYELSEWWKQEIGRASCRERVSHTV